MRGSTFTHGAPAVSPDAATTPGTRWGATPSRRSNGTSEPSANVTERGPTAVAWRSRRNSMPANSSWSSNVPQPARPMIGRLIGSGLNTVTSAGTPRSSKRSRSSSASSNGAGGHG